MLRIGYKGEYFDVRDGEQITCEWVSTAFNDDDEFKGSYSYPVTAPFSPKNNRLLEHANRLNNRSARKKIAVILEIFGQPWKRCSCTYTIGNSGYEMSLLIDNGEFAQMIKQRELPQVFVQYNNGVFADWIYETVGFGPADVNSKMVDSAQNPGKYPWVFFPYKNDLFWGGFDGSQKLYDDTVPYFNQYFKTEGFRAPLTQEHLPSRFYTPFFYLRWVIRKVCESLGYMATGDFFTDPRTLGLVVYNTGIAGLQDLFESPTGFRIKVAYHLPKMKVSDFFKKLRATFRMGIYFDPNEQIAYFHYAPRVLADPEVVDIAGYTQPKEKVKSGPASGFELVQGKDDRDGSFKLFPYIRSFLIGSSEQPKPVESIAGTTFMTRKTDPRPGTGAGWRIPRVRQIGNAYTARAVGSEAYSEMLQDYAKNAFEFRLLNYIGMRPDDTGELYPYATSDDLGTNETWTGILISLWLGGPRGLIETFHRDWYIFFLRTEEVEISSTLPYSVLRKLSPLVKMSWVTTGQERVVAMMNSVTFQASNAAERIAAKISCFPYHNQAATDEPVYSEFMPSDEINPGGLYVRFTVVTTSERYQKIREGGFLSQVKNTLVSRYQDYILSFYSDEAGTIPKEVDSLPIFWMYHFRGANAKNFQDYSENMRASGTVWKFNIEQYHYRNKNDYWTRTYELLQPKNADYIII